MIGSTENMAKRLRMVLPARWFADDTPVLDGLLTGFASTAAWSASLLDAVRLQARIGTATGSFLDIAATDFFGSRVARRSGQSDIAFRATMLREMFRPRATRQALGADVQDVTGRSPDIFEPNRPADTGAWNGMCGYGAAGHWGSLGMPNQLLLTAYRPLPGSPGWGEVSDIDILAAAAGAAPIATTIWTRIES